MARQKTKFSDKFGSGGSKETSKEASLFGDPELEETPEFKAMHLLMDQIDELTDVINANDAGSGSFASDIKNLTLASGSFSTRVTTNDGKETLTIGTGKTNALAGNTTTISTEQATTITNLGKGIINKASALTFEKDRDNNLVITDGSHTWKITAQDR